MNSQLYTAVSGLVVERRRLDLIANNLANASTPGYRAQRLFTIPSGRAADPRAPRALTANVSVAVAGSYDVPLRGALQETRNTLDVALDDGDFLVVESAAGRRYIRGGSLQVSAEGNLTDGAGHSILDGANKPIAGLGPGASVTNDGSIVEDDQVRGKLRVVRDPNGVLQRTGNNLMASTGGDAALKTVDAPNVYAGWLESSGTDAVGELVRLIEAQRAFESYQKLVSLTMNEVNRRAVNELAG